MFQFLKWLARHSSGGSRREPCLYNVIACASIVPTFSGVPIVPWGRRSLRDSLSAFVWHFITPLDCRIKHPAKGISTLARHRYGSRPKGFPFALLLSFFLFLSSVERKLCIPFSFSLFHYLHLALFRSFDRPQSLLKNGRRRVDPNRFQLSSPIISCLFVLARSEFDIRFLPSCILSPGRSLQKWRVSKFKRAQRGWGNAGEEHGDLRNYGRWKTSDLPGDRHLGIVVHQVYGIALHAWLARRSKETNRFTFVPVATSVSVQSIQIILPRVHCLRITRCVSPCHSSFATWTSERGRMQCG